MSTSYAQAYSSFPGWRYLLVRVPVLLAAALITGLAVNLFLTPAELAPGGVLGIAIILNKVLGTSVGLIVLLGNVIMLSIGYRHLGGWNTVILTALFVLAFSAAIDLLPFILPAQMLSDERVLNALYGGVLGGIGGGLMYRIGGTMGGSSILSRILHNRFGIPTSSAYLYVDSMVILLAGLVFGWEASMFSLVALVVDGFVADYVLEGPALIRTATIITDMPEHVSAAIMQRLQRGVTSWEGTGRFTGNAHHVLFVSVARSQVTELVMLVSAADPKAFVVIGHGHAAYGSGFKRFQGTSAPAADVASDV